MSCSPELVNWMEECYQEEVSYDIPENIKFQFGSLPILFKQKDKYYHGVPPNIHQYSWNPNHKFTGHMWIYKNLNVRLPNPQWDSHDIHNFCNCYTFDTKLNKGRHKRFIYKCNGHNL
tara:strand:+ start:5302 stop:5655 length:354 start_codon:yes stop_codon:yes gene_type:complete